MNLCTETIKSKLLEKLSEAYADGSLKFENKSDKSPVTHIDIFVSDLVKGELPLEEFNFFSEEDQDAFVFPCAILDPIDGTRELIAGLPECSLSLAMMNSPMLNDPASSGWIFNPFTGFDINSKQTFTLSPNKRVENLSGLVSNTEFRKGYFHNVDQSKVTLIPKGSIAYKLGLLAAGSCDFVISASPKNVWDIAAGSILLAKRGFKLYQGETELMALDQKRYSGPLLWCKPENLETIMEGLKPCLNRN